MSHVLVLTRNILNEQDLESKLKRLGNEIFTTKIILDLCLEEKLKCDFLSNFHFVLLSETIGNAEIEKLVNALRKYPTVIIRKTDEEVTDLDFQKWKSRGICEWIECNPKIETLRETFSSDRIIPLNSNKVKQKISTLSLTSSESKLLKILLKHGVSFTTREELCIEMWDRKKSNSTMSRLSTLVRHLNQKLTDKNINGPLIESVRGKGYRLYESAYDQLDIDNRD